MQHETLVLWALAAVFVYFFVIAWRSHEASWKLSTFFMGGRNIGAPLAEHTFWGTSFSLANGIYYFAALAFFKGLAVIWLQIPWVLAIGFLVWKLPLLTVITGRFTLHGFLGSLFGRPAAIVASVVTILGFMGTVAFEVNVSAEIISRSLGVVNVVIPLTLVAALTAVAYTDAGGFLGAAKINRVQNLIGVAAVCILLLAVFDFRGQTGINAQAATSLGWRDVVRDLFDFSNFDAISTIGILCFAATTNIVDMSNWQTIAANSLAKRGIQTRRLRWAMVRSCAWIFLVPAAAGSFIGYSFRGLLMGGHELSDTDLLPQLISSLGGSAIGSGLITVVCVGLIGAALSTVDSYLLSTSQTISWDLRREAKVARGMKDQEEREEFERRSVRRARSDMYWYTGLACGLFVLLRMLIGDQTVFVLQFVIFGMITALFPATIYAVWLRGSNRRVAAGAKLLMTLSIAGGLVASVVVLVMAIRGGSSFNAYAHAPIATLGTASIIALIAFSSAWWSRRKGKPGGGENAGGK